MTLSSQGAGTVNAIAETSAPAPMSQGEQSAEFCAKSFGRRCFTAVMRVAQSFYQSKNLFPSKALHFTTGHSLTSCQAWLRAVTEGSGGAVCNLLLTDFGPEVLRSIRAQAEAEGRVIPDWYDDFEAFCEVAKAMRRQKRNDRQRVALLKRI